MVFVCREGAAKTAVEVASGTTVAELKRNFAAATAMPLPGMTLCFQGTPLPNNALLADTGVGAEADVDLSYIKTVPVTYLDPWKNSPSDGDDGSFCGWFKNTFCGCCKNDGCCKDPSGDPTANMTFDAPLDKLFDAPLDKLFNTLDTALGCSMGEFVVVNYLGYSKVLKSKTTPARGTLGEFLKTLDGARHRSPDHGQAYPENRDEFIQGTLRITLENEGNRTDIKITGGHPAYASSC